MRLAISFMLLMALLPGPAISRAPTSAPYGCNLRWNQCFGDLGVPNKGFACNTNSGTDVLVASFIPASDLAELAGLEAVIDLASSGAALPAWWRFVNSGACRQSSLAIGFTPPANAVVCEDWQAGQASGATTSYAVGLKGPDTARLIVGISLPPQSLGVVHAQGEYFAFNMKIDHEKTAGLGACGGCTTPVCLLMNQLKLTTPVPANDPVLIGPSNFTESHIALWQGGPVTGHPPFYGCPAIVSAKQQTWGAVKSLYR